MRFQLVHSGHVLATGGQYGSLMRVVSLGRSRYPARTFSPVHFNLLVHACFPVGSRFKF